MTVTPRRPPRDAANSAAPWLARRWCALRRCILAFSKLRKTQLEGVFTPRTFINAAAVVDTETFERAVAEMAGSGVSAVGNGRRKASVGQYDTTHIEIVVKAFNSIGDEGATQLAGCLRVNATLTCLRLSSNSIGAEGATQLAGCLRVNSGLTSLDLYGNSIGTEGATQLAGCLRVNATLTSLHLQYNSIGAEGKLALQAACPPQCRLIT